MARRSVIERLPAEIREAAHQAIRDGATIDEITACIRALGGTVSRGAVGEYTRKARKTIQRQRDADRFAEIWVREIGERPEGRTGRLAIETLRTIAMYAAISMSEKGDKAEPKEINALALAVRRLEAAGKIASDRELAIRREATSAAAAQAESAGREAGLSDEAVAIIRAAIEGEAA